MKTAIRLAVCLAVVCLFTEGKAQTYSGARLELNKRLDKPTLVFYEPSAGTSQTGVYVPAKMNFEEFNASINEFTTVRYKNHLTLSGEIGYTLHRSFFEIHNNRYTFTQRMFDFRFLAGYADKRNIFSVQAGPIMTILLHGSIGSYSEEKKTKSFWYGAAIGAHLRINKAMFVCRYNYYFTDGSITFKDSGTDSYYRLTNRRSHLSLGVAIILSDGHN
jgi:hypothetical protein